MKVTFHTLLKQIPAFVFYITKYTEIKVSSTFYINRIQNCLSHNKVYRNQGCVTYIILAGIKREGRGSVIECLA